MNKIIPVIAIVFAFTLGTVFSADIATAVKPVTEVFVTNTEPIEVTGSLSADPVCPAENVQHWYTVEFSPGNTIAPFLHDTNPSLTLQDHFVPIQLDSSGVIPNSATQQVADRLNELGYFVDDGSIRPITPSDFGSMSVDKTTVICAEN